MTTIIEKGLLTAALAGLTACAPSARPNTDKLGDYAKTALDYTGNRGVNHSSADLGGSIFKDPDNALLRIKEQKETLQQAANSDASSRKILGTLCSANADSTTIPIDRVEGLAITIRPDSSATGTPGTAMNGTTTSLRKSARAHDRHVMDSLYQSIFAEQQKVNCTEPKPKHKTAKPGPAISKEAKSRAVEAAKPTTIICQDNAVCDFNSSTGNITLRVTRRDSVERQ